MPMNPISDVKSEDHDDSLSQESEPLKQQFLLVFRRIEAHSQKAEAISEGP